MKKLIVTLVVVSLLAALAIMAATSGAEERATTAATKRLNVDDNRFRSTDSLRIRSGVARINRDDIIRFQWVGVNTHNVASKGTGGNRFRSTTTDETGFVYRKRFTRDTRVICEVHPLEMKFKVDVRQDD
jgi:plastocyanin